MRRSVLVLVLWLVLVPTAAHADGRLPPLGRVIVRSPAALWLVPSQGHPLRLAGYGFFAADWSPVQRLLAITKGNRIEVRTASGSLLWSRPDRSAAPRWSKARPARIAFLDGRSVHVIDAAGVGERRLGPARDTAPAWRPGHDELAFVRPDGDVVLMSGRGRLIASWRAKRIPIALSWTGDGRHLVVSLRYSYVVLTADLQPQWTRRTPSLLSVVAAPTGTAFALLSVRAKTDGPELTTLEFRDAAQRGRVRSLTLTEPSSGPVVWSPDSRGVLVERSLRNDWLLVDARSGRHRDVKLPDGLRAVFGGVTAWFR
jgi:hypothetical protein